MMTTKWVAPVVLGFVVTFVPIVDAQQASKIPRVGYLAQRNTPTATTPDPAVDAFQLGLRELGYIDGKNILVDYRYAEGSEERLRALVTDTVQGKVDVLVIPLHLYRGSAQPNRLLRQFPLS